MGLTDKIHSLKGVGPKQAQLFVAAGINTVGDLIDYWPRRYDDYSAVLMIHDIEPGLVTLRGIFEKVTTRRSRRGLHMTEAVFRDMTGTVKVTWFNQAYRAASLKKDTEYYIHGMYDLKAGKFGIANPVVELANDENGGKILAVYRETKKLTSPIIRRSIQRALPAFDQIRETLPEWLVAEGGLMPYREAVRVLHVPHDQAELDRARYRLGFEEVLEMQLAGLYTRLELAKEHAPAIPFDEGVAREFVENLPYDLTDDQRRTVWALYGDIAKDTPMNRLVEGDVGSGKTVVAAMAAVMAMQHGYQVLFMAPTEILARQHAESLANMLAHTPWAAQIGLLVGGLKAAAKKEMHTRITDGQCRLVIGTNALIQDAVVAQNVGLVIIDEQHRFGVEQRQKLRSKAGLFPHVLCMTATPIPRTLALTLYGELDTSLLKTMPPGRTPINTQIVQPSARMGMYDAIDKAIESGRQAFIVCPLIEDNPEQMMVSTEQLYADLSKGRFKHRTVGLLHGGMKPADKDVVMSAFADGKTQLLISTTVIEVGVNVPNATVMVVMSAERFGLAQIHQLRGRVGRGEHAGSCYLVPSEDHLVPKRLRLLETVTDGFRLAELDLELRGPGAIYGLRQSGALDLRIANLTDAKLISAAKQAAQRFVERGEQLLHYPKLSHKVDHFRSVSKLN